MADFKRRLPSTVILYIYLLSLYYNLIVIVINTFVGLNFFSKTT